MSVDFKDITSRLSTLISIQRHGFFARFEEEGAFATDVRVVIGNVEDAASVLSPGMHLS